MRFELKQTFFEERIDFTKQLVIYNDINNFLKFVASFVFLFLLFVIVGPKEHRDILANCTLNAKIGTIFWPNYDWAIHYQL